MNCPIYLDPIIFCKDCQFKRKDGCGFPDLRDRKQLEDFNSMKVIKVRKGGASGLAMTKEFYDYINHVL